MYIEHLTLGDGTGIGKGRQIAGVIQENNLRGRQRALWVSSSAELDVDAANDLKAVDCNLPVLATSKKGWSKDRPYAVVFCSYNALVGRAGKNLTTIPDDIDSDGSETDDEKDEIGSIDDSRKRKREVKSSRPLKFAKRQSPTVENLIKFLGDDFEGVVSIH